MLKKNFKKILLILSFCLFSFVLLPINVLAKDGLTLYINKNNLTIGDELILTVQMPDGYDSYALIATLKYDENVFQRLDDSNFTVNDTESIVYNAENNKFGIINKTGKVAGELFTVRLKVKDNATVGDTNVALTNISSSNGSEKENLSSVSTKILITRDAKEGESIPVNKENVIEEDEEETINTFTTVPFIVTTFIAVFIIFGILIYMVLNKKVNFNKKQFIALVLFNIVLIIIGTGLLISNNKKKDVNNDGVKDYEDAKEIIKYLIDITGEEEKEDENSENSTVNGNNNSHKNENSSKPSGNKKPNNKYDTNNDGKVDVNDAGHVTEETTKNTKVSLKEYRPSNNNYVAKGENTLEFTAEINTPNVLIKQVKIADKYYDVILNNGIYSLNLEMLDAGIHTFDIAEVIFDNGQKYETSLAITKEVLKDIPYINRFNLDDENKSLSFEVVDIDKSFINGTINIYEGNSIIASSSINSLKGNVNFDGSEDKVYSAEIIGNYDLDSNASDGINLYQNSALFDETFTLGGDYHFTLDNISLTDALKANEVPVLSFTSTNNRGATISNANISIDGDSKDYNITKIDGNNYEVTLTGASLTPGKHTVILNEVGLDSLKTFYHDSDFKTIKLTYTVLKEAPLVEDLKLTDDNTQKMINASFNLKDENKALEKLNVVLIDSTGKIIDSKEITKDNLTNNINTSLSYKNSVDGFYKVKVLADYLLADKYVYTNQSLKEESILTQSDIYIAKMYVTNNKNENTLNNNLYPVKKQSDYQIALEIYVGDSINAYAREAYKTNYSQVSSITINGLNYAASQFKKEDNTYKTKIYLNVPSDSGVLDIKANRVQLTVDGYYKMYSTNYFSVKEETLTVDVLKDKPHIDNLIITDDYNAGKATFNFDVVLDKNAQEEEFKDGKLIIGDLSYDIKVGHNEIAINNLVKDTDLEVKFIGSYDLDTDKLNDKTEDKNEKVNDEILKIHYGLYSDETYHNVEVTGGIAISQNNNIYFEKNEQIKLNFNVTGLDDKLGEVGKVIISGKEYVVTKNNSYELMMDGYHSSGEKQIIITDLILTNGQKITLVKPYSFKFEVLKDILEVSDFKYEDLDKEVKVSFKMKDTDNSLVNKAHIIITDENNNIVYQNNYQDTITFTKNESQRYYVKVMASYDRDIDKAVFSDNFSKAVTLLEKLISFAENNIELKEISDINLYKVEKQTSGDVITLEDTVNVETLQNNKDNYFVEIAMDNLPTTRARIINVSIENNNLILELDYNFATYNKTQSIRINFGTITDGQATNEYHPVNAFKALLKRLENGENVVLDRNYDASSVDLDSATYVQNDYKGTLDGNGHIIKNLTKPLFNKITNGEVKDLNIMYVNLNKDAKGALANSAVSSKFVGVYVDSVTTQAGIVGSFGAFIGTIEKSTIDNCKATRVNLNLDWLAQQCGLFIGIANTSEINNSYAEGTLNSGWHFIGAFVGNSAGSKITNSYVKGSLSGQTETGVGFADSYNNNNSTYQNNIAIVTGNIKAFSGGYKQIENNYLYTTSNIEMPSGIIKITEEEINEELFKDKAKFLEDIWFIKEITKNNLPCFAAEKQNEMASLNDYNKDNEIAYVNLQKLMPFYDNKKIITSGNTITDSDILNKEISHIVPVDKNGGIVTYLTSDNPDKIVKIKLIFKNGTKKEYNVLYEKTYDMVASYKILDLNVDYNFNHYVINADSPVINNLTNYLKGLNYTNNLDILTTNEDSRIYKDFYNDTTRFDLRDFVLKYLSNSNFTNTNNDENINDYIEREVKKDQKIEKALYTYNYLRRFYDLDVNGMKIYDFVMFNMQGFDDSLTQDKIVELFFSDITGAYFNTSTTNNSYNTLLSSYTGLKNVSSFLEFIVTKLSNEDMDKWAAKQFKGILVEIPIDGHEDDIDYTLWDHLSTEDANYKGNSYRPHNFVLPILTLPETAAYIISAPAQFTIGSQRTYMANPKDPLELAKFNTKMQAYVERIRAYYNSAYAILQNPKLFNDIHLFQLDKRYTKNENGVSVYNTPFTTTELFHKNFDEVVALWPATYGVNAGNWGDRIEWNVAGFMDTDITTDGTVDNGHPTFMTWSHETAHYLDSRLFLENYGRRFDAGGEDYADAFLMQEFGINGIVMNLTVNYNLNTKVASNLTPERINSPEKLQDFYNKMFNTIYVIDYLEAQAFLQLPKEYQQALAVQVSYPNENKQFARVDGKADGELTGSLYKDDEYAKYRARETSGYTSLKSLDDMEFNTIYDLVDNQIMLYPGIYKYASRGNNSYGGEGINVVHWYQPNNPDGRPDSYALKWISYEMLGYAGYEKGFVGYASNKDYILKPIYKSLVNPNGGTQNVNYKSDKMALEKITDNKYSDFNTYKKDRFKYVEDNLAYLNSNIDAKYYVQKFYEALIKDKEYTDQRLSEILKNRTEENCLKDYWCSRDIQAAVGLPNSTEVRQEIYYLIKNNSNDFREDILYEKEITQDVSDLTVKK